MARKRRPEERVIDPKLGESKFQTIVLETLKEYGWSTMHVRRMFQPDRRVWMTGTSASGWPDVTALRGPYLLALELKVKGKYASPDQVEWLDRLSLLAGCRALVLRPSDDWPTTCSWLREPGTAPRRFGYSSKLV